MGREARGEMRFFGRACGIGESFLIGRLTAFRSLPSDGAAERSLIFFRGAQASVAMLRRIEEMARADVAALVCFGDCPRELFSALAARNMGCFMMSEREESALCFEGRIAIVDPSSDVLIVSPSLETLKAYSRGCERDAALAHTRFKRSLWLGREELGSLLASGASASSGALCSAEDIFSLGEPYEASIALAERFCENPLCVALDWDRERDGERFGEGAEILLCAGVYGELSLMIKNLLTPSDAKCASEVMNHKFCLLEQQAREANGYLLRGFFIDTPLLCCYASCFARADFICFDFDAITRGLLGRTGEYKVGGEERISEAEREALCRFWSDCRESLKGGSAELRALSRAQTDGGFFCEWAEYMDVGEVYEPSRKAQTAQNFTGKQKILDKR